AAELRDLGRPRHRHARAVVAAREAARPGHELAQGPRDRSREQAGHDERETGGDKSRDHERWDERADRVGERGARPRDHDRRRREAGGVLPEHLLYEEPRLAAIGEGAEAPLYGPTERLTGEAVVAVHEDAAVARDDEQARLGGPRLLAERVDDVLRLLVAAQRGRHRGEQRRGALLQPQPQHVVLVLDEEARDRDRGREGPDGDDAEVREEETAADAAHQPARGTSLYPTPQTVSIFASAPASLSRNCFTCTSTVRVSPGYANPQTSSSSLSRVRTMPGWRQNASSSSNSLARSATTASPTRTSWCAGSTRRLPTSSTRPPPGMPDARR